MATVEEFFGQMEEAFQMMGAELVSKVKATIKLDIKDHAIWYLNLKDGNGYLKKGDNSPADLTVTVSGPDFLLLAQKKLNPQQAFMKGKIKVKGNIALAMKLQTVLDAARSRFDSAKGAAPAAPAKAAAPAAAAAGSNLKSAEVFKLIGEGLSTQGADLVKKVKAVVCFEITPGGAWTLDLKNGNGSLVTGKKAADLTITVSDDDFFAIYQGKLNPQQAFMKGKLKAKGNMAVAMKLGPIFDSAKPKAKL